MGIYQQMNNGWTITRGDYQSEEDDYSKKHKRLMRREKIMSRATILFVALTAFLLLIGVLNLVSRFKI